MPATAEALWSADVLVHNSGEDATRVFAQDVATITSVTFASAMNRVALVDQISRTLPTSWAALDRGRLTLAHVKALAHVTAGSTPRVTQAVEDRAIPAAIARGWTPSQLARAASQALIAVDPDGATDRAAVARQCADISFYSESHESATIVATGDAIPLRRVMDAIDTRTAEMGRDGDQRAVGQRRLAALEAFVLGNEQIGRPHVETVVTIDLTSLLGLTDRPGELSRYGPITADTARELSKDASLRRLITDPANGRMLDLGRRRYRPSHPPQPQDSQALAGRHQSGRQRDMDNPARLHLHQGRRDVPGRPHRAARRHQPLRTHRPHHRARS